MLYAMDQFVFPEVFQTWCAAVRDQAAVQWIAGATVQHQVQSSVEHAVEAGAELLVEEMEVPFLPPAKTSKRHAAKHRPAARHH